MARRLTTEEKIEIVLLYGEYRNFHQVQRRWKDRLSSQPPDVATISSIVKKFKETGSVHDRNKSGRPRSAVIPERVEQVKQVLIEKPNTSIANGSLEMGMSYASYQRAVKETGFRPYRPHKVVELSDDDFDRREEFCTTLLAKLDQNLALLDKIVWSDESLFKINGVVNRHNCCYWAPSNPHEQYPVPNDDNGVMVWCGLTSSGIIGPYFFEEKVTGESYLAMLEQFLWPKIKQKRLWFQQDGAPAHYASKMRSWLDEKLSGRWLGRRGPIEWPARSPDLTPCDFFLWGYLKDQVYKKRPATIEELRDRITAACAEIPIEYCANACRNVAERLKRCQEEGGKQQS